MKKRPQRFWSAAACSSALFLVLTACGNGSNGSSSPATAASGSDAPANSTSSAASTPPPSPSPSQPSSSPSASPEVSAPDAGIIAYKLNKVYNIVPIDKTKSPDKVVLLTFDDGPKEAEMLGKMLDVLDKHKAKAIFFVNGYRVKAHPELLKEIHKRGQVIGNHSWDHINLLKEKEAKVIDQIGSVQEIVKRLTGTAPVFFRPPFGAGKEVVRKVAKENGLLFMTWSNGSLDWDLPKKTTDKPQAVIDNVMKQLHPGSNILMHELQWTADALDRLLTQLEAKDYSFVDPNAIEVKPQ